MDAQHLSAALYHGEFLELDLPLRKRLAYDPFRYL